LVLQFAVSPLRLREVVPAGQEPSHCLMTSIMIAV
jgi:hypothetical protein